MKRFDPALEAARDFIRDDIGEIFALKAWYCDSTHRYTNTDAVQPLPITSKFARKPDGNPKADLRQYFMLAHGSHLVDTARFLCGEITAVRARLLERAGAYCWFVETEFANGALGHLDLTVAVRMDWHEGFQLYGENGSVLARTFNPWYLRASEVEIFHEKDATTRKPLGADGHFFRRQLEGLADHGADRRPDARRRCRGRHRLDPGHGGHRPVRGDGRARRACHRDRLRLMQLGIFAKTFAGSDALPVLTAVRDNGFATTQFNLACVGLPSMPDIVPPEAIAAIRAASRETGVSLAALSGTYNMAHPDKSVRDKGLKQLRLVIETAAALEIPLVTLCTGTRNAEDQWAHHPDNADPLAWRDMAAEMGKALEIAERSDVNLGIEPEQANIVTSAADAMRLIGEMGSKRLGIVLDPANLFEKSAPDEASDIVDRAVDVSSGHVVMAHAKDRHADGSFATAGKGIVDFPRFVAGLRATGFDGPLVTHGLTAGEAPDVARFLADLIR
jgi:sugar phosphate isomerase/epimerase